MKIHFIILTLCLIFHADVYAEDAATLKKQLATEVELFNSNGSADFVAACINVTRQVQEKKIRIYAISSDAKTGVFKDAGLTIEIIYNKELAELDSKVAGTYYQLNNQLILAFAASRFTSGDKDFSLRLVRMIAAAGPEPDLFES